MENQLVRTDRFLYKMKRFFRNLFIKRNSLKLEITKKEEIPDISVELEKIISCKTEAQETDIKEQLSKKIINKEIAIKDLADTETEEMIEFFKLDIKLKSDELSNAKKQLAELKKESKKVM